MGGSAGAGEEEEGIKGAAKVGIGCGTGGTAGRGGGGGAGSEGFAVGAGTSDRVPEGTRGHGCGVGRVDATASTGSAAGTRGSADGGVPGEGFLTGALACEWAGEDVFSGGGVASPGFGMRGS